MDCRSDDTILLKSRCLFCDGSGKPRIANYYWQCSICGTEYIGLDLDLSSAPRNCGHNASALQEMGNCPNCDGAGHCVKEVTLEVLARELDRILAWQKTTGR